MPSPRVKEASVEGVVVDLAAVGEAEEVEVVSVALVAAVVAEVEEEEALVEVDGDVAAPWVRCFRFLIS